MKYNKILYLIALALFSACSADEEIVTPDAALEIRGITATIGDELTRTRADVEEKLTIGRSTFVKDDNIVFTEIHRTNNKLTDFSYSNIQYTCEVNGDSKSWERILTGEANEKEKIYWSDGQSAHTFIGYSLPQGYSWTEEDEYNGQLGTTDFSGTDGKTLMQKQDVLLSYSLDTKAETGGLSTKVNFTHALSCVQVVVDINSYAASSTAADTKIVVSNMVIKKLPTKYKWNAKGSDLEALSSDSDPKNITLWCKKAEGEGSGEKKTFTFYGLTVPHTDKVSFSFTVQYPDPLDANNTLTKTYSGEFSSVAFKSGMCTVLKVSLNHENEQMYMSVDYRDWKYVGTPDLGVLRKKSTFMEMDIKDVTISADKNATADDATWLYNDGGTIKDVYGHLGTDTDPYIIKSASQMLSFAKEVNSDNGVDFTNKYIRLDADITMQASTAKTSAETEKSSIKPVEWIGIGDATHSFNGTFLGGDRYINRLYGKPLFISLGKNAVVEQLHIAPIGTITGGGALADSNAGKIGGCKVVEDVKTTGGALVGTNSGIVYACYYTGSTDGVAGIVGTSSTKQAVGCYMAGNYSLYEMQQTSFVKTLNDALDELYKTNTNLTQFWFKHNDASYPTVTKDKQNN